MVGQHGLAHVVLDGGLGARQILAAEHVARVDLGLQVSLTTLVPLAEDFDGELKLAFRVLPLDLLALVHLDRLEAGGLLEHTLLYGLVEQVSGDVAVVQQTGGRPGLVYALPA